MLRAFVAALAAAVAFGVASLFQEAGARRAPAGGPVGLRLLGRFARQPAFLAGTGLDAAGFVLTFLALRRLPLFAVEAAVSSAVAVTAVGSVLRGGRLARHHRVAVAAVVAGLGLVGAAARPEAPPALSGAARLTLLAGVPALAVVGMAAGRRRGRRRRGGGPAPALAPVLGGVAGLAFALFGVAGRVLPGSGVGPGLVAQPLAWAAAAYAGLGLLLYGAALQRGPVTAVAAATAAVETIVPAAAGLFLGGGARPGLVPVAVLGFLVTTAATLVLVRPAEAGADVPGCPESVPEPDISGISPSRPRRRAPLTAV